MSYFHMFYGLDLDRLRSIYGSKDQGLAAEILKEQTSAFEDNDGFFEDELEEGTMPNSEVALGEIIAGKIGQYEQPAAMYGYVLKILCEHLGEQLPSEVAAIRDHPYKSQLVASGPPIPIPYDPADFPEIGYLSLADIPAEIKRIDAAPRKAKKSLVKALLRIVSGNMVGREMGDEDVAEDMAGYREVLEEAQSRRLSIVSFRH